MSRGKIIVIEGTDCSGKETQSKLLVEKLNEAGIKTEMVSFPCYETATGKIVAGPLLGKNSTKSYFKEGLPNVDPKLISLYYAADRKYNIENITNLINSGVNVILDRYVYSNMAFQGSKYKDDLARLQFFDWVQKLEFELLELPKSDINIFLHVPVNKVVDLLNSREEKADENECNTSYLKSSEETYFLLASKYNFKVVECVLNDSLRTIEDINNELYKIIIANLK